MTTSPASVLPGTVPALSSRRRASPVAWLWARVAATDPGLLRLLLAARGTLSVGLTVVAVSLLAHVTGLPMTEFAFGAVFSMVGPFLMRDTTRRQRQTTLLLLLPPAAMMVVVSTLVAERPPLGEVCFLCLVFVAALLQARHPRALGLGLVAVIMTYVGLYLQLAPQTLGAQLGSLVVAAAVIWVVCFVLLPLRPVATLRRAVRSVQRRAGHILREAGADADPNRLALRRHLARLNEAALAAEDQLVLLDDPARQDVRLHLFELEQAVSVLVGLIAADPADARQRGRLLVAGERLRWGRASRRQPPNGLTDDPMHAALAALTRASAGLEAAAGRAAAATVPVPAAKVVPGPLGWRNAVQVTLASLVAMIGGMALSPQRWFWAVVAVYVVFLNTRSRGDAIYKGSHRVIGTLGGLFGGLVIAATIHGNGEAEAAIMLAAVFGTYYFYAVSYSLAIFCVTVLLGMVYGTMGTPLEPLLVLRLEETAIGVLAAILAASFVWPIRTRHQVRVSGHGVLTSLRDVIRGSVSAMAGEGTALAPIEAVRRLDRQIVDLRLAMLPLTAGRFIMRRARAERPVTALLACAEAARALAASARDGAEEDLPALQRQAAWVEARIVAMLSGEAPPPMAEAVETPAGEALRRLDLALEMLAERVEENLLDGFAV